MRRIYLAVLLLIIAASLDAQNVGIGTTTPTHKLHVAGTTRSDTIAIGTASPRSPLSFGTQTGQKITLYDDGNAGGNNYGIGVQGGLLQFHSYTSTDNIVFGYGKSTAMTERMRIINNGGDGLIVNGRITLKNGTNPLDINYGSGIWMYKADNSALLGFVGVQNNQNLGFYGGPAGWGFTYDAINSRVGIGNNNPNAPLAFPPLLGKKITLYPGATGDVGFAVAGNRLQIYSDNPNADVAIGYDAAGTFNERFAFKPNGALAVNGSTGTAGQVLTSNGAATGLSWISPTNELFNNIYSFSANDFVIGGSNATAEIPGLNQNITLTKTSKVLISLHVAGYQNGCVVCTISENYCSIKVDGINPDAVSTSFRVGYDEQFNAESGLRVLTLAPGVHNFAAYATHYNGGDVSYSGSQTTRMTIIVVPQ